MFGEEERAELGAVDAVTNPNFAEPFRNFSSRQQTLP